MLSRSKYLGLVIIIIIVGGLLIPQPASAQLLTGFFDLMNMLLGGIEEVAGPIAAKLILVLIVWIVGFGALVTSTTLLTWVVGHPDWLSLQGNAMVEGGWHFTAGIANMFLILILIVIALSFILKIETFQIKKTLPKLIIVALLINFSLLFVGMIVDIANIISGTIIGQFEGLIPAVVGPLAGGIGTFVIFMIGIVTAMAISFFIPVVNAFAQLGLVLVFPLFIPLLVVFAFQMITAFLLSGIFFAYTFIFAARVFIIQIFAILAPLAFVCLILPQTKKYWDMWLKIILEWAFLGIVLLFFLVLGFRGIAFLTPTVENMNLSMADVLTGIVWFKVIKAYFLYYFFLVIYLLIIAAVSQRLMPIFATNLIEGAKAFGMGMWTKGIRPVVGGMGKQWIRSTAKYAETKPKTKAELQKMGSLERLGWKAGGAATRPTKMFLRAFKLTPEMLVRRETEQKAEQWKKQFGADVGTAATFRPRVDVDRAAQLLYLSRTKGGEAINKLSEENQGKAVDALLTVSPEKIMEVAKYKPELIEGKITPDALPDETLASSITAALVPKGIEDKDVQELINDGKSEAEAIKKVAFKKAAEALKNSDIENLDIGTIENSNFQEAVALYKPWGFIRALGEEKGRDYISKIQAAAATEKIAETNPGFIHAAYSPAGRLVGMVPFKNENGKELNELEARELIKGVVMPSREVETIEREIREAKEEEKLFKAGDPKIKEVSKKITGLEAELKKAKAQPSKEAQTPKEGFTGGVGPTG